MEDYKKLLTDLYTTNDPERVKQIDYFLERYKGKEEQFYISQKAKYKSRKPVSDSKKIIEEALARIKSQSADKANKDLAEKPKAVAETVDIKPEKDLTPPIVIEKTPSTQVVEETKKEIKVDAASPKEPIKKNVWFEEKPKVEEKPKKEIPPPKAPKSDPPPYKTDKHFNKKYFLYIFGSVVLVIILVVIVFFIFFYSPRVKKETKTAEKPKTTITTKKVKAEPKKTTTKTTTAAKPAEKKEIKKATKKTTEPAAKTSQPKQTSPVLNEAYIKKGSITLPAYFVACSAVKSESLAIKKANELKSKGFDACYYWIPDFVAHGNPYFKVVIGPFSTRMDAMRKLTPVQERAEFDAYVLELK